MNNYHYPIKIAVIIPVYNAEKTIKRAIDSVLNQTLKEIVIICIDDKSTDESLKIMEDLAKTESRIIVLRNEKNLGCGGLTRNVGLNYLFNDMKNKVEYVAFLDSDDIFSNENYFDLAYNKLKQTDSDMIVSTENIIPLKASGKKMNMTYHLDFEYSEQTIEGNCLRLIGDNEKAMFFLSNKTAIVKKELIKNLRFSEYFGEDSFYFLYELSLAKKVTSIPGKYYNYYYGSENSIFFKYSSEELANGVLTLSNDIVKFWKERGDLNSPEKLIIEISILLSLLLLARGAKFPPIEKLNELYGCDLTSKEIYENPKLFKMAKKLIDICKNIKQ